MTAVGWVSPLGGAIKADGSASKSVRSIENEIR